MFEKVRLDMHGKVALVTGGGYGMGRATARRFAQCGAAVVVADIDKDTGPQTVEMIRRAAARRILSTSMSVTKAACGTLWITPSALSEASTLRRTTPGS